MNTQKRLIYAMKNLIDKNDISSITLPMICRESDVSKATFYRYFSDKYDLMSAYYRFCLDHYLYKVDNGFYEGMIEVLKYIRDNRTYFSQFVKQQEPDDFFTVFYKSSCENGLERIRAKGRREPTEEEAEGVSLFTAGCTYIVRRWIENDMKESMEQIAGVASQCIPESLKKYF